MSFFESFRYGVVSAARAIAYDPVDRVLHEPPLDIPTEEPTPQAVLELLNHEDHAVREIGHLANGNRDNAVTKVTRVVVQNNGAVGIPEIAIKTGLGVDEITITATIFKGHLAIDQDIVIAEVLNPLLPQSQDVYIA